ncbi:hypothetical protein F2P81_015415 [Scophthalmus maximus]|uniref:Uncharacterized protein n=1 Tax=Scophthalmus maximus TaxID=52904 RepID=A0A6A4SKR7_SCOMX|nr:hypothetical protein F2P81_015415 [Scophthalmus maximus]
MSPQPITPKRRRGHGADSASLIESKGEISFQLTNSFNSQFSENCFSTCISSQTRRGLLIGSIEESRLISSFL